MLVTEAAQTPEIDCDELILEYLPQVKAIATRIAGRLQSAFDISALNSAGLIGLLSAIDTFDASRNVPFKTFACHKILDAILEKLIAHVKSESVNS